MPSPFPGMNPYLEEPVFWPGVHTSLAVALRDELVTHLPLHYYVTVELRVYETPLADEELVGVGDVTIADQRPPARSRNGADGATGTQWGEERESAGRQTRVLAVELPRMVEVRERYLEIRRPRTHEVITVIEVLSPSNKRSGKGRQLYEDKRTETITTRTNLIEIDLLRAGEPLPVLQHGRPLERSQTGNYRVLVSRGHRRHRADLHVIGLREPLPTIPIPLRPEEDEPQIDLQSLLHAMYDRGGYSRIVDYRQGPVPPLPPEDAAWADDLLRRQGLR